MLVLRHVSGNRLEQLVGRQAQAAGQSFDLIEVRDAAPTFDEQMKYCAIRTFWIVPEFDLREALRPPREFHPGDRSRDWHLAPPRKRHGCRKRKRTGAWLKPSTSPLEELAVAYRRASKPLAGFSVLQSSSPLRRRRVVGSDLPRYSTANRAARKPPAESFSPE